MTAPLFPNEPYRGVEGRCAECGETINLATAPGRFDGTAPAPDGLPAPVFVLLCQRCYDKGEREK